MVDDARSNVDSHEHSNTSCCKQQEDAEEPLVVRTIRQFLGNQLRVEISDGRYFTGTLLCVDQLSNVILSECEETRRIKLPECIASPDDPNFPYKEETLHAGSIVVPGKVVKRFLVSSSDYKQENGSIVVPRKASDSS